MKVISLWQPWASLVALDLKRNETRSWYTHYRGPLAIHAAKIIIPFEQLFTELPFPQRMFIYDKLCDAYGDYHKMPTGAIVASTNLLNVMATEKILPTLDWLERACGDYSSGRFAFKLCNTKMLAEPIPAKGRQRFWDFDMNGKGGIYDVK
jgi:activating signal cointegrator 1